MKIADLIKVYNFKLKRNFDPSSKFKSIENLILLTAKDMYREGAASPENLSVAASYLVFLFGKWFSGLSKEQTADPVKAYWAVYEKNNIEMSPILELEIQTNSYSYFFSDVFCFPNQDSLTKLINYVTKLEYKKITLFPSKVKILNIFEYPNFDAPCDEYPFLFLEGFDLTINGVRKAITISELQRIQARMDMGVYTFIGGLGVNPDTWLRLYVEDYCKAVFTGDYESKFQAIYTQFLIVFNRFNYTTMKSLI
jgi:hypothetical protein